MAPKPPEPRQSPEPLCAGTDRWFLADVDLRDGDDYAWLNIRGFLIEEVGIACERAMNTRVCLTQLDELKRRFPSPAMPALPDGPLPVPALVTTAGDRVAAFTGPSEIIDYFLPIDRIGEAKLALVLAGRTLPYCMGPNNGARRAASPLWTAASRSRRPIWPAG